jgi:hypothetical protein
MVAIKGVSGKSSPLPELTDRVVPLVDGDGPLATTEYEKFFAIK